MPSGEIMHDFSAGTLHSGKGGPIVKDRSQALAIMESYKRKELASRVKKAQKKKGGR